MAEETKKTMVYLKEKDFLLLKLHCAKTSQSMNRFMREAISRKIGEDVSEETHREVHQILKKEGGETSET